MCRYIPASSVAPPTSRQTFVFGASPPMLSTLPTVTTSLTTRPNPIPVYNHRYRMRQLTCGRSERMFPGGFGTPITPLVSRPISNLRQRLCPGFQAYHLAGMSAGHLMDERSTLTKEWEPARGLSQLILFPRVGRS